MKKTKIDWCDCTINPVVGCPRGCPYCYAKRMNTRYKWIEDWNNPQFFPERLKQLESKKPKAIFMNSMSDIAEWKPEQLRTVIASMLKNKQHRYIALTKNFLDYLTVLIRALGTANIYVLNEVKGLFFVGETITRQRDIRFNAINTIPVSTDFINVEPILEPIDLSEKLKGDTDYELIIIGAETGNRKGKIVPKKEWIDNIVCEADKHGIRVFMKESLHQLMGEDFRQDRLIWEIGI